MILSRFARKCSFALSAWVMFAAGLAVAADLKWDPKRNTPPESVDELRALQDVVNKITTECTPYTVGIKIGFAQGSGVIVNKEGLVLTAGHVSGKPGESCRIVLHNGTEIAAKTLGYNKKMDSGMIQITKKSATDDGWPFATMAKSSELKVGQWLVALGHPNGYKKGRAPVARLGQVQAIPRDFKSPLISRNNLMTSCILVGGDSGGPLFDLQGRLVGIHSQISLSIYGNMHVPVDEFKNDWEALLNSEVVVRKPPMTSKPTVTLGVEYAEAEDEPPTIASIEKDSPAAKAGLRKDDVILKFEGKPVSNLKELNELLLNCKPDQEVELEVKRGKRTLTITLTLASID